MPKNIPDCLPKVSQLMEGIMMIAATQRLIDNVLLGDFRILPDACVPELFREKEEPAEGVCQIAGEVESLDMKHRKWVKEQLYNLSDEFTLYSSEEGDDYARLSKEIKEQAYAIKDRDKEPLTHLPQFSEIISENIFRMFTEFDSCMKEK